MLVLLHCILPILHPLSSLSRYVELNYVDDVVHCAQNALPLFQNRHYPFLVEVTQICICFVVYLLYHVAVLNLVYQYVYFVCEMVVGQKFQKFMLNLLEKLADL